MSESSPLAILSTRLCPWLGPPLARLEESHRAARLGHAWLITGPAGTGKINLALVFAERLLDEQQGAALPMALDAADAVAAIRDRHVPADRRPDLHWVFPEEDKRSISVEQIRAVGEALSLKGFSGGAKVVIIEPADAMTVAAANALLKTLEEPTPDTYLLLLSHEPGSLPSTIRSRCQTLAVNADRNLSGEWLHSLGGPEPLPGYVRASAPLLAADCILDEKYHIYSQLEDKVNLIYEGRMDPQTLADEWEKQDVGPLLAWLAWRLQTAIRDRFEHQPSNPVTDRSRGSLHNVWAALPLRTLFEQLAAAESLRRQAGGGINVDLSLRALLFGFARSRN